MITYFDRLIYLYPNTQGISYKFSHDDGTPWDDPYEGVIWENDVIPKPSKADIEALDESAVATELAGRKEVERKTIRNEKAKDDLGLVQAFQTAKLTDTNLTFSEFLDSLENFSNQIDISV